MRVLLIGIGVVVLSWSASAQQPKPAGTVVPPGQPILASRLHAAEIFVGAEQWDAAEKELLDLLRDADLNAGQRSLAEGLLGRLTLNRKALRDRDEARDWVRLELAERLIDEGEYAEARRLAAGVIEKTQSPLTIRNAAGLYARTYPGLLNEASVRLLDMSKWEWIIYAVVIAAGIALLLIIRRVLWAAGGALDWSLVSLGRIRTWLSEQKRLWIRDRFGWHIVLPFVIAGLLWLIAIVFQWTRIGPRNIFLVLAQIGTALAVLVLLPYVGRRGVLSVRLRRFDDPNMTGAASLLIASMSGWSRGDQEATTGLLIAEASRLPDLPQLTLESIDLVPDLGALPAIGGVSPGVITGAFQATARWLQAPYPILTGSAHVDERLVRIRLTWQRSAGTIDVITAEAPATERDALLTAVNSASYQMLFILSGKDGHAKGVVANALRKALTLLREYISDANRDALHAAISTLTSIRSKLDPGNRSQLFQVHLYEGIARDLNEEHELARTHFERAAELAPNGDLKEKAAYNKAVSQLRSLYQLENLRSVIGTLRQTTLIPTPPALPETDLDPFQDVDAAHALARPVYAFSYAVMADAIAHFPIYWSRTPEVIPADADYEVKLRSNSTRIETWVARVEQITQQLGALDTSPNTDWDETARLQLMWLIQNARGDVYLNSARYLMIPTGPSAEQRTLEERRREYLRRSFAAFRQCEVLLPAGVETLSNIGTVLLTDGKPSSAREYFERAITLNPAYEYAYYRIAQSWEEEKWREKLVDTLKRYPRPPQIPEFRRMYRKYFVQPAAG
jgi:tetratricopeptide (TPR) repeat protein